MKVNSFKLRNGLHNKNGVSGCVVCFGTVFPLTLPLITKGGEKTVFCTYTHIWRSLKSIRSVFGGLFHFYDTLTGKEHLPLTYPNIVYDILVNAMITKKFK